MARFAPPGYAYVSKRFIGVLMDHTIWLEAPWYLVNNITQTLDKVLLFSHNTTKIL